MTYIKMEVKTFVIYLRDSLANIIEIQKSKDDKLHRYAAYAITPQESVFYYIYEGCNYIWVVKNGDNREMDSFELYDLIVEENNK